MRLSSTSWVLASGGSGTWSLAMNQAECARTSSSPPAPWQNCTWLLMHGWACSRPAVPLLDAATELTEIPQTQTPLAGEWTVGAALIHAYEELAQHLGHLEVTADLLLADR